MFCNRKASAVLLDLVALFFVSCGGPGKIHFTPALENNNCAREFQYGYSAQDLPRPIHELNIDTILTNRFSFRSLNVANAIGLTDQLSEYVNLIKTQRAAPSIENKLKRTELSLRINRRIDNSSLEISSVAGEIDCEEERTGQVADFLSQKENETESRLTVASIIAGAAGAIGTGLLLNSENNSDDYVQIAAGVAEAAMGMLILLNKRHISFTHTHNPLRDIWNGNETSQSFPASVWYYLSYYDPQKPDKHSYRYQIISGWMDFGQIATARSSGKRELVDLYFGDGGNYTVNQLQNRANMLDQLESRIKLMKQDLRELARELDTIE